MEESIKTKFLCNGNYPFVVLIVLSGLILAINQVVMHIRHTSTVYNKYYHDGLQYSVNSNLLQRNVKKVHEPVSAEPKLFVPVNDVASSYHIFKDVIPRTAYYGSRYIAGSDQDVVIVLAEVSGNILDQELIMSCLWNNQYSTTVKVIRDPIMRWVRNNKQGYTHFFAMIYCLGLKWSTISGNDVVKIIYRAQVDGVYRSVDTEKPLRLLNNASCIKKVDSILVCATMYGHPVRFEDWLRYQKTIGVDRVHLSVQVSFVAGIERYPFLIESLANEFVKLEVWKQYLKENEIFYHSQSLVYQDCVMQYQCSFEYAAMIDYDDFFIPVIPSKRDIHYYVNRVFDKNTASVRFPWIELPCAVRNHSFLVDGNITQTFSKQDLRIKRIENKSIHRLSAVELISIHQAYKVMPGYVKVQVKGVDFAYFTHIRPRKRLCTV